jgi:hypothetical protein
MGMTQTQSFAPAVQAMPVDCDAQLPLPAQHGVVVEQACATSAHIGAGVARSKVPLVPAMSAGTVGGGLGLTHVPVVEPGGTTQA